MVKQFVGHCLRLDWEMTVYFAGVDQQRNFRVGYKSGEVLGYFKVRGVSDCGDLDDVFQRKIDCIAT
jgi:hypothetical protein